MKFLDIKKKKGVTQWNRSLVDYIIGEPNSGVRNPRLNERG